ncbi:hypothetical protein ACN2MM_11350 [Alkalilimnicola ehrlichii MLHE-1]|uniref:hypothetical protein n=1 Tax=Alkalilimnicola ehrlichii TaxID=351052 RepID=UPI00005DD784|nr:hypothetical protein [Alkalilimnicola ehrlichii]
MPNRRYLTAFAIAAVISMGAVWLLAWLINNHDWGVAMMLIVPLAVFLMIRLARRLDRWARDGG